jgi:hypothetical protein
MILVIKRPQHCDPRYGQKYCDPYASADIIGEDLAITRIIATLGMADIIIVALVMALGPS